MTATIDKNAILRRHEYCNTVVHLPDSIRGGHNPWTGTVDSLIYASVDRDMTDMAEHAIDAGLLDRDRWECDEDDEGYDPDYVYRLDEVLPRLLATNLEALRTFADDPNAEYADLLGTSDGGQVDAASNRSDWDEVWWDYDPDAQVLTAMYLGVEWQLDHETHGLASAPLWHGGQFYHGQCGCGSSLDFSMVEVEDVTVDKLLGPLGWSRATSPFAVLALEALPSIHEEWEDYAEQQLASFLRDVERGRGDIWEILDDDAAEYEQGIYLTDDGRVAYATPYDAVPLTGSPELVAKAVEAAIAALNQNSTPNNKEVDQ